MRRILAWAALLAAITLSGCAFPRYAARDVMDDADRERGVRAVQCHKVTCLSP
jgi:hypothetical protein